MLLKVLGENRVKILMEDRDVELYDLPFERLNYDDPLSRAFIYELIQKTYDQTGVNFRNCRLMIEVVPGVSRTYYIILSKIEESDGEKIEFDKTDRTETEMYIFKAEHGEDVLKFFGCMKEFKPITGEVYLYGGNYYITLSFSPGQTAAPKFPLFLLHLEEYAGRCRFHYVNESVLKEWGQLLVGPDAFEVLH